MTNIRSLLLGSIYSMAAFAPADAAGGEGTAITTFTAQLPTMSSFDPQNPAAFGNSLLSSLLKAGDFDDELAAAVAANENVKKYMGFELAKAVMAAAEDAKNKINLFHIFEGKQATEKLFSKLMQYFGIITREIEDEEVVTKWSSPEMAKAYDMSAVDKEKDEAEYNRRFNNRKRLNMRFTDAVKTAVALMDNGTKSEQLKLVENATTKEIEPVIENAPAFLRGDQQKNGSTVKFGQRNPNEGAKVAPTVAALVRAATEAHTKKDETTGTGERADKGNERSGDAKLGMSDEDFGGLVNNLRRAIGAQEGQLTEEMVKQLKALGSYIAEQVPLAEKVLADKKAAQSDEPSEEEVAKKVAAEATKSVKK